MATGEGWTKTPNTIFDAMSSMRETELKLTLALVRMTYGYQRDSVRLTYDEMVTMTNLSRGGLSNAINAVIARGFFRRGNKSMWFANSSKSELSSIDESLNSELSSKIHTTDTVNPIDNFGLNSEPNNTSPKEIENNNIYSDNLTMHRELNDMINALRKATKTKYGVGFNEEKFEQAASMLLRDGVTLEQVEGFPAYWRELGWGGSRGLPTLEKVVEEMDNCINRVDTRPAALRANTNGTHSNGQPTTEDPAVWKLVTEAVSLGNYKGLTPEQVAAVKRVGPMAIKDRNDFTANRVRADFFRALQGAKC